MLVAENRDSLARFFENLDDLLKQLVTRVKNLAKLVYRVVAVLNDQGDRIDVQPAGSAQRLGHGLDQPDAVPLTKLGPRSSAGAWSSYIRTICRIGWWRMPSF